MSIQIVSNENENENKKYPYLARGIHEIFRNNLYYVVSENRGLVVGLSTEIVEIVEHRVEKILGKITIEVS